MWCATMRMSALSAMALLAGVTVAAGQQFAGRWEGILTQPSKTDTFYYELSLTQQGQTIAGVSRSRTPDGKSAAAFTLTGFWDGKQLVLQEVEQTEPSNGGWCLKYATLSFRTAAGFDVLEGNWKADRCSSGHLQVRRQNTLKEVITESEVPFSWAGRWTGHLSQSDRDYGFFYELQLDDQGRGRSYIVSEDNGGSAFHELTWQVRVQDSTLLLQETLVSEKTDDRWKWCIKSAQLRLRREGGRYLLSGTWSGYLEGHTPQNGRCAPGDMYLEQPIVTRQERYFEQQQSQTYASEAHREVRVSRVVEVQKPTIRIRVWDSGTVDGDVATLFLNGKKILHKYRVTKSKYAIPVTLQEDNNFLILHAEDLGNIPPNTVAVSIDDGVKEQVIILSSDLKTSGAILIRQFKISE